MREAGEARDRRYRCVGYRGDPAGAAEFQRVQAAQPAGHGGQAALGDADAAAEVQRAKRAQRAQRKQAPVRHLVNVKAQAPSGARRQVPSGARRQGLTEKG